MITVTGRDTCRAAYVDPELIVDIQEMQDEIKNRAYPYSRIFIKDSKQNHDFYLDVTESKKKIDKLIKEAKEKKKNPVEKQGPPEPEDP